jgi:cytochrome c oxidase subunit 3
MNLPLHRREILLYGFIASLAMFFGFGLAAFVIIRGWFPPTPTLILDRLPIWFWMSSVFLWSGSHSLFLALDHVKRERQTEFRGWLKIAMICAIAFTVLQTMGIAQVLLRYHPPSQVVTTANPTHHETMGETSIDPKHIPLIVTGKQNEPKSPQELANIRHATQFSMIAVMVGLHVIHFAAGIVFLWYIVTQAHRDRYDHEYYSSVKMVAYYWRFLDIVWIAMLVVFCFTR